MTDPMQQFRGVMERLESALLSNNTQRIFLARAAVEALHAAALAQQGGVKVPDETVALTLMALGNYIHYPAHWDTAAYPELADALCELGCPKCRAEVLRLNAARPADQDASDHS